METKREKLESQLSALARALDGRLEDVYGNLYQRYPNRLPRGKAANPAYDGLFSTTVPFTLGYGSQYGRGYIVQVDIDTLEQVSGEEREKIKEDIFKFVEDNLVKFVPDRNAKVVHDGNLIKIIGDLI